MNASLSISRMPLSGILLMSPLTSMLAMFPLDGMAVFSVIATVGWKSRLTQIFVAVVFISASHRSRSVPSTSTRRSSPSACIFPAPTSACVFRSIRTG